MVVPGQRLRRGTIFNCGTIIFNCGIIMLDIVIIKLDT